MKLLPLLSLLSFSPLWSIAQATFFQAAQSEAGIDHVVKHNSFMGGGAAFFDFDNDGDDDLYITSGRDQDHFYVNQGNGTFVNVSTEAGFAATADVYTMGVVAGDFDNNGFKDLFVTTNKSELEDELAPNLLFKNNGDGTFTEVWNEQFGNERLFSIGATLMDYDLDGWLDIYVITYVEEVDFLTDTDGQIIGFNHDCFANRLYHNQGSFTFVEKASSVQLDDTGCALAAVGTDFDWDGDPDILIANDFGAFIQPNKLYENNNAVFTEVGAQYSMNTAMYGMGIAIGDVDQDLDMDYYITNFGKNALFLNQPSGFEDITDQAGVGDEWVIADSTSAIGWGTAWIDIDNDTDLDLFVSNGYVPSPAFLSSQLFMNDKLFLNNGDLTFTDTEENYGIGNKYTSRGMAYADYDNDGDLDLLSVVLNVPINEGTWQTVLNRNDQGNQQNWLQVSLEGVEVNRDGYGSYVLAFVDDKQLLQEVNGGASHCSHSSSRLHFGLGTAQNVDSLYIWWTGKKRLQRLYDLAINQHVHIVEDTTIAVLPTSTTTVEQASPAFTVFPNPASDILHIQCLAPTIENSNIVRLYDATGQLVQSHLLEVQEMQVNIGNVPAGLYYVHIESVKGVFTKKIIIQ